MATESVREIIIDLDKRISLNSERIETLKKILSQRDTEDDFFLEEDYEEAAEELDFTEHDNECLRHAVWALVDTYDEYLWYYDTFCSESL